LPSVTEELVRAGQSPARDHPQRLETLRAAVADRRTINDRFRYFAGVAGAVLGSPWSFLAACLFVATWAATGPYFNYSNGWQLVINTSTTIGTFLMVFLLQSTQNRDTKAINIKLDELLRAIEGARTGLGDLSELTDDEIEHLERELVTIARKAGVARLPDDGDCESTKSG
jgi:low affinity Fe/Cu permease